LKAEVVKNIKEGRERYSASLSKLSEKKKQRERERERIGQNGMYFSRQP
jgi:hypothetical protein